MALPAASPSPRPLAVTLLPWFFWLSTLGLFGLWLAGPGQGEAWLHHLLRTGPVETVGQSTPSEKVALRLLALGDPAWLCFGAALCYLHLAAEEGLPAARRGCGLVLVGSFVVGCLLVWLGGLRYTTRLGPRLGPVPFGLPLLWCVLLLGARDLARWLRPRTAHGEVVLAASALLALGLWPLERLARVGRVWWFWPEGAAPLWSGVAWLAFSAAALWLLRGSGPRPLGPRPRPRAAVVFLALQGGAWLAPLSAHWL